MNQIKLITIVFFLLFVQTGINAQTIVWKKLASLPKSWSDGESVVLNNKIYCVGGRNAACTYVYDISENKWEKLSNLPTEQANLAVAAIAGKIYAIGGDLFSNNNYEYISETDSWKELTKMPTKRQHIDCGIVNKKIHVIGGLTSWNTISKKNEVYDVETDTWSEKAAIPTLRNGAAIVTLDSLIYVIGGGGSQTDVWKTIATVEFYNTNTDHWTTKSNMPIANYKPGAVVVNNKIFVLGGQNNDGVLSTVLLYDPKNDTWKETTPLPKITCFAGYVSVGNKIYVIGGTTYVKEPSTGSLKWTQYSDVYEGTVSD
jgi:N-acetylneuraminic acid mutarotase